VADFCFNTMIPSYTKRGKPFGYPPLYTKKENLVINSPPVQGEPEGVVSLPP